MLDPLDDTEWDAMRAGHDRAAPLATAAEPKGAAARGGNRRLRRWAVLALVALTIPIPTQLLSEDGASRGIPRDALFSFSPTEMLLPPVDVALARLAAESASAGCWVQQLHPRGSGCAGGAAAR